MKNGGTWVMSELNRDPKEKEREYSDTIPDEEEIPSP
jgi:hypothetical protein